MLTKPKLVLIIPTADKISSRVDINEEKRSIAFNKSISEGFLRVFRYFGSFLEVVAIDQSLSRSVFIIIISLFQFEF